MISIDLVHVPCCWRSASRNIRLVSGKGDQAVRKWKAPKIIEIAIGMEINCYACATA